MLLQIADSVSIGDNDSIDGKRMSKCMLLYYFDEKVQMAEMVAVVP